MKKHQQRRVLEILQTIEEAQSAGMYDDCLKGAHAVGEFINKVHGENTETVRSLEQYCDMLCQMAGKGDMRAKLLKKQLNSIINNACTELNPDKIEVAFFPYKASMADSLETIYIAAKADSQCDAYWIPIPYFDRKANGVLGEIYYEGMKYPDYLEITDWQNYDVAERHPDIVFIHNPYDGYNYVTSVHPNYYSAALKKCTDLLVYVDYGIPYSLPKNPGLCITANKINILPYQINCDLIIAYSDECAECGRLAFTLSTQLKKTFNKHHVKEKVVPLGSAKFDKVLRARKEDYSLPNCWNRLIGNKKVLLFNTSLSELLHNGEKSLAQIVSVIKALSKRDDIVLWWRPHPLTESAINSMRPELAEKYAAIIKDYKRDKFGIFDCTEDVHRAIAYSDGCLTNYSSLMYLYLATGKPFTLLAENPELPPMALEHLTDFRKLLMRRIQNMKTAKGANIYNLNTCIWWNNFATYNSVARVEYDNWLDMFLNYIVNKESYPEAEEYEQLQLQMFRDSVVNSDGAAGEKIYQYCKERVSV